MQENDSRRREIRIRGREWRVERRHESAQLAPHGVLRARRLFVYFVSEKEVRRAEVPEDFPAHAGDDALFELFGSAERVSG